MRSQKINIEKVFDNPKLVEENQNFIQSIREKYDGFVTLLDFATEWIESKMQEKVKLPYHILEDSGVIPQIKPRFYSIVNDPFPNGESKTQKLEFAFSLTKFLAGDK